MILIPIYIIMSIITSCLFFWVEADHMGRFDILEMSVVGAVGLSWFIFLPLMILGALGRYFALKLIELKKQGKTTKLK